MQNVKLKAPEEKIISLSFNQDFSLFTMGTENGFKIFNTFPFNKGYDKPLNGGISKCEMLYRSNYLALIGGGKTPKYNINKVVLYDDAQESIQSEFKFITPVLNVKLKKNLIFIVCETKLYVFNLQNTQNIDCFDTSINKRGLIAISGSPDKTIIAYPIDFENKKKGFVSIKNYKNSQCFPQNVQDDDISCMAIDYNGLLLATSNEKGTIIRIHSCKDGTLLQECKGCKEKAEISYMCFDINYKYFGISNEKKIIYIWKLDNIIEKKYDKNDISKNIKNSEIIKENKNNINEINFIDIKEKEEIKIKKIDKFIMEKNFANIRINESYFIFCFIPNDNIIIITQKGIYYKADINKKGGECYITYESNIINNKKNKKEKKNKK